MNLLPVPDEYRQQGKDFDCRLKGWRDLVILIVGVVAGILALLCTGVGSWRSGARSQQDDLADSYSEPDGLAPLPCTAMTGQQDAPKEDTWQPKGDAQRTDSAVPVPTVMDPPGPSSWHISSEQVSPYAYVLMAHDVPDLPAEHIWRAIALARALQRLSQYPVLLLTNTTHLPDGTSVSETFWKLNVQVLPLYKIPLPKRIQEDIMPVWRIAFWKLQIWRMTQYEKLIWLDTDAIVFRSIDYIFERRPLWGQRDAWVCSNNDTLQNWLCSGLMLIEPNEDDYRGLLDYSEKSESKWWDNGDQRLILEYFRDIAGQPVQLLDISEAAFGKCLDMIPNPFNESMGSSWNIPAFVHKSSVHNECFYFIIAHQLREIEGTLVNVCHYHPLGPYWRDQFCDGLRVLGVKFDSTETFCNDHLWYGHR